MVGKIHSVQSLGAVDGPGLRTVIFTQGCLMQCAFCHSIDTTPFTGGTEIESNELVKKVLKNRAYWKRYGETNADETEVRGGVTITGGEPTAQPIFTEQILKELKEKDIHTAVDTSLFTNREVIDSLAPYVDLWMVSIKHMNPEKHIELTGRPNKQIFDNLEYLDTKITYNKLKSKIRIRYVVVPGLTDEESHAKIFGRFIKNRKNIEGLELLPYVSLGRYKWIEIFGSYKLDNYNEATPEDIKRFKEYLNEFEIRMIRE